MAAARSFVDLQFWQRARTWSVYERVTGKTRPAAFHSVPSESPLPSRNDEPPL